MNAYRKIQFSAAAVIANGALALGLLSPGPTLAAACGPVTYHCAFVSNTECLLYGASICQRNTPPGCIYVQRGCTHGLCGVAPYDLTCLYTSA
jgi:hypothetical protein